MKRLMVSLTILLILMIAACTVQVSNPGSGGSGGIPTPAPTRTWPNLGVSGRLMLIEFTTDPDGVWIILMDLKTGNITPLFTAPTGAFLGAAVPSPDGKHIALTYSPPPTGSDQNPDLSLYLLPADGTGSPQPIFKTPAPNEDYIYPAWSADSQWIYCTHLFRAAVNSSTADRNTIAKVSLDGQEQTVLTNGFLPVLSPDGTQIAYISPTDNSLYLADINGANPHPLLPANAFFAVDYHFFTPDGKSLIFSAVNPIPPTPTASLFDRLFGVIPVWAHSVPSDWYQVSVTGSGPTERLTNLADSGMYATLSPDGTHVAFIAQDGLYVMQIDGSGLTYLSPRVLGGTVAWLP